MAGIWLVPIIHFPDPGHLRDEELRETVASALETLAGLLTRHPGLQMTLHLPGRFVSIADRTANRSLDVLRGFTREGRLEWLGGGYYEPLFPLLPPAFRQTQMQMLDQVLRQRLQARPRGVWLPEFVWDPGEIPDLFQAGFEYTVLKDYQVFPQGLPTGGWVLTEELACPLKVVLSQEPLGALFRAGALDEMLGLLRHACPGAGRPSLGIFDLPLMGDGTISSHAERLARLCELCAEDDAVEMTTVATVIDHTPQLGSVCIGTSASRDFGAPGPGGGVRDLLRRNAIANRHHKSVLQLWSQLDQVASPKVRAEGAECLQRAMNADFFRGAEEGDGLARLHNRLRMTELRLQAESFRDSYAGDDSVRVDTADLLCNGAHQIAAGHLRLGCLIEPARGGRLISLTHKPRFHDWGLCQGPDRTAPHAAVADPDRSAVLLEHFLSPEGVEAGNFAEAPFEVQYRKNGRDLQIVLSAREEVTGWPVRLEKVMTLRAGKSNLTVTWKITNVAGALVEFDFALESNLSPSEPDERLRHKFARGEWADLLSSLEGEEVRTYLLEDRAKGIFLEWNFNKPARCMAAPVRTPDPLTPEGMRFQGVCVWPQWHVRLDTGESWSLISLFDLGNLRRKSS